MSKTIELSLTEKIQNFLSKYGSTQRWFVGKLNDAGIEMSDTKLSNRMTGAIEWQEDEIKAINDFLENFN